MELDEELHPVEVRVLGALIEKQITTPDYYPLTLNALVNACNQKSNRNPVVFFDDRTVESGLSSLFAKKLAVMVTGAESRVPKYRHLFTDALDLQRPQVAALCALMLRGPLTGGEIRSCTGRLHGFADLGEVHRTLDALSQREPRPLVKKLPRQIGRKESRYAHLLAGEPQIEEQAEVAPAAPAAAGTGAESERISTLEGRVEELRTALDELKQQFAQFKEQFE